MGWFFAGFLAVGFVLGSAIAEEFPNDYTKDHVICEYLSGKIEGTVCIKNDRVIDTERDND